MPTPYELAQSAITNIEQMDTAIETVLSAMREDQKAMFAWHDPYKFGIVALEKVNAQRDGLTSAVEDVLSLLEAIDPEGAERLENDTEAA